METLLKKKEEEIEKMKSVMNNMEEEMGEIQSSIEKKD